MSATNPRGAVIAAVVGAAAAVDPALGVDGELPQASLMRTLPDGPDPSGPLVAFEPHDEPQPARGHLPASYPPCVREPWVCSRCNGALCGVDRCPMGGEHDPGDSDRPCPRCGASPR